MRLSWPAAAGHSSPCAEDMFLSGWYRMRARRNALVTPALMGAISRKAACSARSSCGVSAGGG